MIQRGLQVTREEEGLHHIQDDSEGLIEAGVVGPPLLANVALNVEPEGIAETKVEGRLQREKFVVYHHGILLRLHVAITFWRQFEGRFCFRE